MALEALWTVLNLEVSRVSKVQAPIHKGLLETPALPSEVSEIYKGQRQANDKEFNFDTDTLDTLEQSKGYQLQPLSALGFTPDTRETSKYEVDNKFNYSSLCQTDSKSNQFSRLRKPWLTTSEELAANAYHAHHFNCRVCIAAGKRYGNRCQEGLDLWHRYRKEIQI